MMFGRRALATAALMGGSTVPMPVAADASPPSGSAARQAAPSTPQGQVLRTAQRRAVDAVIWGMPLVSLDAMRQAYLRDAGAKYNDIIWWPRGSGWKNQSLTVNTTVRYMYFFCNTREDGPIVVELPPAVAGASSMEPSLMRGSCPFWISATKAQAEDI